MKAKMQPICCIILKIIAEHIKLLMNNQKIKHSNSCCPSETILEYMNICIKQIIPKSRKVQISKELAEKINNKNFILNAQSVDEKTTNEIIELINHFTKKFEQGDDLNNHLSQQIFQSKRFDTLLNIWNIKHLHLSKKDANSKTAMKNNRSNWLLFFIINNDNVYFIDVLQHPKKENFIKYNFLKTIFNNNWMELSGFKEISEAIPGSCLNITDDDTIYKYYSQNINIRLFEFNDKVYFNINNSISCLGDKMSSINCVNKFKKQLNNILNEDYYDYQFQNSTFKLNKNSVISTIKTKRNISQHSTKYQDFILHITFTNQEIIILNDNKKILFQFKFNP